MGIAAVIGMGLSFVGVILVWTTFAETRRANEIAANELHASTRPLVVLDGPILRQEGLEFAAGFTFKNIGKDPAQIEQCTLTRRQINRMGADNDPIRADFVLKGTQGLPHLLIPNERTFSTHTAGISGMQIIRYRWLLEGVIKYRSVFDPTRIYETVAEFEVAYLIEVDRYGTTMAPENAIEDQDRIIGYDIKGEPSQRLT